MPRMIMAAAAERANTDPVDGYKERLLKFIPAEVITLYMTLDGVVGAASGASSHNIAQWVIFALGLVGTPLYLRFGANVTKGLQISISTAAFVVWVFALGGPFAQVLNAEDLKLWGAILLPAFTFGVANVKP